MKKLLIELFIILPIALILFIPLILIGLIYTLGKHVIKWDYKLDKQLYPIIRSFNLSLDGFCNVCLGELLNDVLKINRIKYGKWYHTISAVTGLIYKFEKRDSFLRRFLDRLEKNHCVDAITEEQEYYYNNKI